MSHLFFINNDIFKKHIIPFMIDTQIEASKKYQYPPSFILKGVKVMYLYVLHYNSFTHTFKIEDDIINSRKFKDLVNFYKTDLQEYFRYRCERVAVARADESNVLYRNYKLRNKEYIICAPCFTPGTQLIKNKYYTCNIKFQKGFDSERVFLSIILDLKIYCDRTREVVSEFIDEDD